MYRVLSEVYRILPKVYGILPKGHRVAPGGAQDACRGTQGAPRSVQTGAVRCTHLGFFGFGEITRHVHFITRHGTPEVYRRGRSGVQVSAFLVLAVVVLKF